VFARLVCLRFPRLQHEGSTHSLPFAPFFLPRLFCFHILLFLPLPSPFEGSTVLGPPFFFMVSRATLRLDSRPSPWPLPPQAHTFSEPRALGFPSFFFFPRYGISRVFRMVGQLAVEGLSCSCVMFVWLFFPFPVFPQMFERSGERVLL